METFLAKNGDWMITTATLFDDGIELCFADGLVPFAAKSLRWGLVRN